MYWTYVLISLSGWKTYVGITGNLEKRLEAHNSGFVKSSCACRPYKILFAEEFSSMEEARKREIYYKSRTGRRRLKEIFNKTEPSKC